MSISTPVLPKPPACVLAHADAMEQLQIDRWHDKREQELLAEAIAPALQDWIDSKGLYTLVGAIELMLGRELGPSTGEAMVCSISLRPAAEAQGWF
jgi:hypothetical protein